MKKKVKTKKSEMSAADSLYEILCRGGVWSSQELGDELGIEKSKARLLIAALRNRFRNSDEEVPDWIYVTRGGYTLDDKPEHVMYEARLRFQLGVGAIVNGSHVFKKAKRIASTNYKQMMLEYKPKALMLGNLIK